MQLGQEETQESAFRRCDLYIPVLIKKETHAVHKVSHDRTRARKSHRPTSHGAHLLLYCVFEVVGVDAVCGLAHH